MDTSSPTDPTSRPSPPQAPPRLASVDAYRGLAMFLMMAEGLELGEVARSFPRSPAWQWLAYHQSHVDWQGASIHDMIQPSFTFLVGVALPFSMAARLRRGDPLGRSVAHAAWRAFVLVALGVLLRSVGRDRTNFTFEDTLSQIGLGYFPLFLLALARPRWQWLAFGLIIVGTWAAFAAYPAPGADFDYRAVGVPGDWPHHASGLASHWNKNGNLASAFDRWFLNRFPRESTFLANGGGYATLSFVPTLATMILGLIAGGWLLGAGGGWATTARLVGLGLVGIAAGLAADRLGVCPVVKRIWTPSWVLFSGGICLVALAGFYAVVDVVGLRGWTYPIGVIGRNSIAAYCLAHLVGGSIEATCRTHLGASIFATWGEAYEPLAAGAAVLVALWLILFWMDRRRIYLKV